MTDFLDEIDDYIENQVYVDDTTHDDCSVVYDVNKINDATKSMQLKNIPIDELKTAIETPMWKTRDGEPITIKDVLKNPDIDREHYDDMFKVDTDKPIFIAPNGDIMDGTIE